MGGGREIRDILNVIIREEILTIDNYGMVVCAHVSISAVSF